MLGHVPHVFESIVELSQLHFASLAVSDIEELELRDFGVVFEVELYLREGRTIVLDSDLLVVGIASRSDKGVDTRTCPRSSPRTASL